MTTSLHCLIVDDEPSSHMLLERYIDRSPLTTISGHCYNAAQAAKALKTKDVDLLFLDITMPEKSGFDLLRDLDRTPTTVIVTAHPHFALEAFNLGVRDYLLKPISYNRFAQSLSNVSEIARMMRRERTTAPPPVLVFQVGRERRLVDPRNIAAVKADGNFSQLLINGESILVSEPLKQISVRLEPFNFQRVHKSWLVNLDRITSYQRSLLLLDIKVEIPVGRAYRRALDAKTFTPTIL